MIPSEISKSLEEIDRFGKLDSQDPFTLEQSKQVVTEKINWLGREICFKSNQPDLIFAPWVTDLIYVPQTSHECVIFLKRVYVLFLKANQLDLMGVCDTQLARIKKMCSLCLCSRFPPTTALSLSLCFDVVTTGNVALWNVLEPHFGTPLTLEILRNRCTIDLHRDKTGLWLLFEAALNHPSPLYGFDTVLKWDITLKDLNYGPPGQYRVIDLHLMQLNKVGRDRDLCLLLDKSEGRPLLFEKSLDLLAQSTQLLLRLYSIISELTALDITDDALEALSLIRTRKNDLSGHPNKVLIKQAIDLAIELHQKHKKTEGYYFIAKYLFNRKHLREEALSCFSLVDTKSVFFHDAVLHVSTILSSGDVDYHGREITDLPRERRGLAVYRATQEALKRLMAAPPDEECVLLKRTIVAKLLQDDHTADLQQLAWVDYVTDFTELLSLITSAKHSRKLDANQAKITELTAALSQSEIK